MKTWILVWFLVYTPAGPNKDVIWESSRETNLTMTQCFELLTEKDVELRQQTLDGNIVGHELYCREEN